MYFDTTALHIHVPYRGKIDDREWRFLLTGGVALENPFPNPATDWLTDKSWAEIVRCCDLPAFQGFMEHFQRSVSLEWEKFIKLWILQRNVTFICQILN